jgi:hypothetical protein
MPPRTISAVSSREVVLGVVDRSKLIRWLAMNLTLAVSAIVVYFAQLSSRTKTVRNTTLVSITMDLSEVTHSPLAPPGLCNAVELSKEYEKLGRMKWVNAGRSGNGSGYCHKVRFADEVDNELVPLRRRV